jgi:UDP-N-acetylmuramoylalanine--D-glutamate ligase
VPKLIIKESYFTMKENQNMSDHEYARHSLDPIAWRTYLESYWLDRTVAIWGIARSGIAVAQLLNELGAQVILSDARTDIDTTMLNPKIQVHLGEDNIWQGAEILIPSPGIPPHHQGLIQAQQAGIKLMSEIEVGAFCTQATLIAITGTDGKSTCTSLFTHVLQGLGYRAHAVGNIGDPLSNWSLQVGTNEYLVVEVSAFQLWSTHYFPAKLAILTNIAEDHHDYFGGDALLYRAAKLKLARLLPAGSSFLWPDVLDVEWMHEFLTQLQEQSIQAISYGLNNQSSYYVNTDGYYTDLDPQKKSALFLAPLNTSTLIGRHHQRNVLAILAGLRILNLDHHQSLSHIALFKSLPHRMALVRSLNDVIWINDSKATNAHASLAGLQSVDRPLHVICGGYDKSLDLSDLLQWLYKFAQHVYLIGDLAPSLYEELQRLEQEKTNSIILIEISTVTLCHTLSYAVECAHIQAQPGSMVILSPASSSFDQFKSFEHRGEVFENLVNALMVD